MKIKIITLALSMIIIIFSQPVLASSIADLERLVAPVALYDDNLLGQIFAASTHPEEISEANEYLQENGVPEKMPDYEWDPSVKSLLMTPDILSRLDMDREWTSNISTAVSFQIEDLLKAVQNLRKRAMASGALQNCHYMNTSVDDGNILINSINNDTIYCPSYSPDSLLNTISIIALTFSVAGRISDWWNFNYCDWNNGYIGYRPWNLPFYSYKTDGYYYNWYYMSDRYIHDNIGYYWYPPRRGYMPPPPHRRHPHRRHFYDYDRRGTNREYISNTYISMPKEMRRVSFHRNTNRRDNIINLNHNLNNNFNNRRNPHRPDNITRTYNRERRLNEKPRITRNNIERERINRPIGRDSINRPDINRPRYNRNSHSEYRGRMHRGIEDRQMRHPERGNYQRHSSQSHSERQRHNFRNSSHRDRRHR